MMKNIRAAVDAARAQVAAAQGTALIDSTVTQFNTMRANLLRGVDSLRRTIQANDAADDLAYEQYLAFRAATQAKNEALDAKVEEAEMYLALLPAPPTAKAA